MTYNCKLYKDNAGGLHLAVLDNDGTCVYYLTDLHEEIVLDALAALKAGGDPITDGWEGGEDDPVSCYRTINEAVDEHNGGAEEVALPSDYDLSHGITRNWEGVAREIKPRVYWWNGLVSDDMPIYAVGGALYCATGWNGESYLRSFRVIDRFTAADDKVVELRPIYRFQDTECEFFDDSDDGAEIIGFDVN